MPSQPFAARAALLALALTPCAAPPAAAAQGAGGGGPGITLDEVVSRALEGNPQIHAVRAREQGALGRAEAAGARFEPRVGGGVAASRQSLHDPLGDALDAASVRKTGYSVEAVRQLRSGITIVPGLAVSRTEQAGLPVSESAASVSLGVGVPLMRDRFGRSSTAPERALRLRAQAASTEVRHVVANGAAQAADAYWEYAAAHARLSVLVQAEERALRRLDETRTLVRGDERPAADLPPLEAALARARAQRITAEQGVDEARTRLGLVMGLGRTAAAALPPPATPFPRARGWTPGAEGEERLIRFALESRADLETARLELRSDDTALQGAREELKPQLDMHVSVGYAGRHAGPGREAYFSPLYRDVPGLNAALRFEYQFPLARTATLGALAQSQAARTERALHLDDLTRRIAANVSLMARAVERGAAAVDDAEKAVALYRVAVENEQQKHRLGAATLIDVTFVEDNLTSAQLSEVSSRLAYTRALVQLRLETGTLAEDTAGGLTVNASRMLTLP